MIKAVVFDMDGILFDTERLSMKSFCQAAEELGLTVPDEAVYGVFGLNEADGKAFFMNCIEKKYPNGSFPYDVFMAKHHEIHAKLLAEGVPVMKGVQEILAFLTEKGIKLAVASSTRESRVRKNLDMSHLTAYFDAIITGDMVEHSKPMPDIYQKACAALNIPCQEAVAVEDSPNGIRSAHAAGMFSVMVPDMIQPTPEMEDLSDLICEDLLALKDYLEGVLA